MKQVRETAAAKAISVFVILKKGEIVAKVHAHYNKAGACTVDVWDRSTVTYQGRASGYGYDKFVSALVGAEIEGVKITDHCGGDKIPYPKGLQYHPTKTKAPKGYYFANGVEKGYQSCYRESGLDILKHYGMTVEQVL